MSDECLEITTGNGLKLFGFNGSFILSVLQTDKKAVLWKEKIEKVLTK